MHFRKKAEDTLSEFAAVKKADIQLQTQLGNRKGQIGINVIGAFAELQNSAFGWQVRAFGAENDTKGANAGIFFRRVDGESLYGINSFVDYEKGDYGEFLRYGIGGELQNRYVAFAANLYLPITDDKHNGATVAFSQEGYDANLRINIPQLDFLKVAGWLLLFWAANMAAKMIKVFAMVWKCNRLMQFADWCFLWWRRRKVWRWYRLCL